MKKFEKIFNIIALVIMIPTVLLIGIMAIAEATGNRFTAKPKNEVTSNIDYNEDVPTTDNSTENNTQFETKEESHNSIKEQALEDSVTTESDKPVPNYDTQQEPEQVASNSNESIGQKNALSSAQSYLDFTAFSYEGLIAQLVYDKYSHEDAVYAVENCGANWNEQALRNAQSYIDFAAFSYSGLIHQLQYDKYTTEQATYGADNCGADWNEQAAESAQAYLEFTSFSREGLIEQLKFDGYTQEQALYGAEANGY